jgi:S-adenosylmethionine:tRNA-ribosyltransferase-isomerase (queuine synthetase)
MVKLTNAGLKFTANILKQLRNNNTTMPEEVTSHLFTL